MTTSSQSGQISSKFGQQQSSSYSFVLKGVEFAQHQRNHYPQETSWGAVEGCTQVL